MTKLALIFSILLAVTVLAPSRAEAYGGTGYICHAEHFPNSPLVPTSAWGSAGYLYFTLYTAANCSGTYLGSIYVCSTGNDGTNNSCSNVYSLDEIQLMALYGNLQRAVSAAEKITANPVCFFTCGTVLGNLIFWN